MREDRDEWEDVEWDPIKAASNIEKHGVSFEEAVTVLGDPLAATIPNPVTSDEFREVHIGHSQEGRLLVVVTALAGHTLRVISARQANKREQKAYEERD